MTRCKKLARYLDFAACLNAAFLEAARLPHLELISEADKRNGGVQVGVGAKVFRKDDAAVAIDRENLDVAVECDRQLVALI